MTLVTHKKYIYDIKTSFYYAAYTTKDAYVFLDLLLDNLKKIKKEKENDVLSIFDYRDDSSFTVNKNEAQDLLDQMYQSHCYEFFFKKHKWCKELIQRIQKDFFGPVDFENAFVYLKILLLGLSRSLDATTNLLNEEKLFQVISKQLYFFPEEVKQSFCVDFIKNLISNGFLILDSEGLLLDLSYFSLLPPRINDDEKSIEYSCYYCSATLVLIVAKFTKTRNSEYFFALFAKLPIFLQKKVLDFFDDYYNLDFTQFAEYRHDDIFYKTLKLIYIDKIILNDFIFNSIIISCFEKYYFDANRPNIMYDKSGDLVNRLIP